MKRILLALAFLAACLGPAFGQAQFPANTLWGNPTGAQSLPRTVPLSNCASTALLYIPGTGFACATAAQITASCNAFSTTTTGCVPVSPGGTSSFLRADGSWAAPPTGTGGNPPGGATNQVQINAGGGAFGGITNTQLTADINTFTASLSGAVPAAVSAGSLFLRGDGTWASPATSAVTSVSNADGTLSVTPSTGAVVASLALGHANTWTATQTFSTVNTTTFQSGGNTMTFPGSAATLTQSIASGTLALATTAIASATCTAAQTATATGVATTDVIDIGFSADPTAVTGYIPATSGMLTIIPYPTANTINVKVCNNTSASITPGAVTLNWRVRR